jgi:hypothetical protein
MTPFCVILPEGKSVIVRRPLEMTARAFARTARIVLLTRLNLMRGKRDMAIRFIVDDPTVRIF